MSTIYFTPYPTQNVSATWPSGTDLAASRRSITIQIPKRSQAHRQENTIRVTCRELVEGDGRYTVHLRGLDGNTYKQALDGTGRQSFVFRPLAPGRYILEVTGNGRFFTSNSFDAGVPAIMVAPDRARVELSQLRKSFKDESTGRARFRVTPTIINAWGLAQREIFVMRTGQSPAYDEFIRVATLVDLGSLSRTRPAAVGETYLSSEFTKIYDEVDTAENVGPILQERVDALFDAYNSSLFNFDTHPVETAILPGTVSYISDFERAVIALNNAYQALLDASANVYSDDFLAEIASMEEIVAGLITQLSAPGNIEWDEVLDKLTAMAGEFNTHVNSLRKAYGALTSIFLEPLVAEDIVTDFEDLSGVDRANSTPPTISSQLLIRHLQTVLRNHLDPHNKHINSTLATVNAEADRLRVIVGALREDQLVVDDLMEPINLASATAGEQNDFIQGILETLTDLAATLAAKKEDLSEQKDPHGDVVEDTERELGRAEKAVRTLCPNFEYPS